MKSIGNFPGCFLLLALVFGVSSGCESTGGGNVSGGVYYGTGFYDPWYYGDYDDDIIIVPPPGENPPDNGLHPTHPIAPPQVSRPRPQPLPSIPSTPRPAGRGGGRR